MLSGESNLTRKVKDIDPKIRTALAQWRINDAKALEVTHADEALEVNLQDRKSTVTSNVDGFLEVIIFMCEDTGLAKVEDVLPRLKYKAMAS